MAVTGSGVWWSKAACLRKHICSESRMRSQSWLCKGLEKEFSAQGKYQVQRPWGGSNKAGVSGKQQENQCWVSMVGNMECAG